MMEGDIYDILINEYGLTPEQISQMMELGVLAGEAEGVIPRQQEYAQELRGVRTPRGRSYGGVYTSADPLEHIGAAAQNMAGHYGEWKTRERQQEILKEQASKRQKYLQGMRGRQPTTPQVNTFTGAQGPTSVPWNEAPVLSMQGNRWNR